MQKHWKPILKDKHYHTTDIQNFLFNYSYAVITT